MKSPRAGCHRGFWLLAEPAWDSIITNCYSKPGVPYIVQSARPLKLGEIVYLNLASGELQPFAVKRFCTAEEWIHAIRALGLPDHPDSRAVCFAEVVTD